MSKNIDDVLFVNFHKAVKENNPKILGHNFDDEDLVMLLVEYNHILSNNKKDRLSIIKAELNEIVMYMNAFFTFVPYPFEFDVLNETQKIIIENLKRLKFDVSKVEDIKKANDRIKLLETQIKQIERNMPKSQNKDNKTAVGMLASLSDILGMRLNPKEVTVAEYVEFYNIVKKKAKEAENNKK